MSSLTCLKRPSILLIGLAWAATVPGANAEIIRLTTGGELRGKVVASETNETQVTLQPLIGGTLVIDRALVEEIADQSANDQEYDTRRQAAADTAEAQLELAKWCHSQRMEGPEQTHLKRVLELDPNHAEARRMMGFVLVDGKWLTQEQRMIDRGYQRYKGSWRLPQEIEILERKQKDRERSQVWFRDIGRWRGWLDHDNRTAEALEKFQEVTDPYAVPAIREFVTEEPNPNVRDLYVRTLAQIASPDALAVLVRVAMQEEVEEIRLTALDCLAQHPSPELTAKFVEQLKSKNNVLVNRAGVALGVLKDRNAIRPLIEALFTVHKFEIKSGGNPGQMSGTFGSGSNGGMSFGSQKLVLKRPVANPGVFDALVEITGMNFDYNELAWREWYVAQQPKVDIRPRRDD